MPPHINPTLQLQNLCRDKTRYDPRAPASGVCPLAGHSENPCAGQEQCLHGMFVSDAVSPEYCRRSELASTRNSLHLENLSLISCKPG